MSHLLKDSYFLNKKYKIFEGNLKISKKYGCPETTYWLEFYDENGTCIGKTPPTAAGQFSIHFSIDVSKVTELTIKACDDALHPSDLPFLTEGFSFFLTPV